MPAQSAGGGENPRPAAQKLREPGNAREMWPFSPANWRWLKPENRLATI
jgi:hypothetical protein